VFKVGLPETRENFFTKENYPQKVDTDQTQKKFDVQVILIYYYFDIRKNKNKSEPFKLVQRD